MYQTSQPESQLLLLFFSLFKGMIEIKCIHSVKRNWNAHSGISAGAQQTRWARSWRVDPVPPVPPALQSQRGGGCQDKPLAHSWVPVCWENPARVSTSPALAHGWNTPFPCGAQVFSTHLLSYSFVWQQTWRSSQILRQIFSLFRLFLMKCHWGKESKLGLW